MDPKNYLFLFLVFAFLPCVWAQTESDKPNIVLLVADDLGYGELGCQGNEEIPTPPYRLARQEWYSLYSGLRDRSLLQRLPSRVDDGTLSNAIRL